MLIRLEVQWADLSEIKRAGLEPPPGCPGFPSFHPSVGPPRAPIFSIEKW